MTGNTGAGPQIFRISGLWSFAVDVYLSYRQNPRSATTVVLLLLQLLAAGCIEFQQKIDLKADGNFTVSLRYSVPDKYFSLMQRVRVQIDTWQDQPPSRSPVWPWNGKEVAELLANNNLDLTEYKTGKKNGHRNVLIKYRGEYDNRMDLAGIGFLPLKFEDDAEHGTRTLSVPLTSLSENGDTFVAGDTGKLASLCKGLTVAFRLTVPGEIISTTGNQLDEHSVAWEFKTDEDPSFLHTSPVIKVTYRSSPAE